MTMENWQKRLIPGLALPEGLAEEVTRRTRELLATRGWCLWKCASLNSEVIALARDELVEGVPERPVYTEAELEELCQDGVSEAHLRLVHEAKRIAGAIVISVKDVGRGNHAS